MAQSFQLFAIVVILGLTNLAGAAAQGDGFGEQPLSKIAIEKATINLSSTTSVKASPSVLGLKDEDTEWVTVDLENQTPTGDDSVGVFSPARFK
ncbi:hypothetical protein C1H46_043628 [Malus baccata]|uniref:Purple acid phosphatase Fn3-like domain-containing protein n=1 Tax=Malus baccata TaxID=106549 RepID=A0A540K9E1_MALBA|nr:hypothetical protein C1H46_043628 [Malus baccata]